VSWKGYQVSFLICPYGTGRDTRLENLPSIPSNSIFEGRGIPSTTQGFPCVPSKMVFLFKVFRRFSKGKLTKTLFLLENLCPFLFYGTG